MNMTTTGGAFEQSVRRWFTAWTIACVAYGLLHLGVAIVLLSRATPQSQGAGGVLLLVDAIVTIIAGTKRLRSVPTPSEETP